MTNRGRSVKYHTRRIKGRTPTMKTNSIALLANNSGQGCILEWHGVDIYWDFENVGGAALMDHGLDDAPDGLSIWEGFMYCSESHTVNGHEYDANLEGEYRDLTPEEWKLLQKTGVPWELEDCDDCGKIDCECEEA